MFEMCSRQCLKFVLLFLGYVCNPNVLAAMTSWLEYELAGFDNADGGLIKTNLKSKRYDKATFGITGTIEILYDFTDDWEAELALFYSAKGNNQYVKTPYKVPKADLCKQIEGIYRSSGTAKDVGNMSDLPKPVPNEPLCPMHKKGNYTVRQYLLSKDVIPKFLQPGLYKAQIMANKKNSDEVSTFVVYVKLY